MTYARALVLVVLRRALARARAREPRRLSIELACVVLLLGILAGCLVGLAGGPGECLNTIRHGCLIADQQVRP